MQRIPEIDFARGIAILMMAIFHFTWDLNYFGALQLDVYSGFWGLFQKATLSLFLLVVGITIAIKSATNKSIFSQDTLRRAAIVLGAGLLVSAFTFVFFPNQFIYFGVLHLIGISILFAAPFARKKYIALTAGALVIMIALLFNLQSFGVQQLVWAGFGQPSPTLDFVPLFPWFGVVLVGIFLGNVLFENGKRRLNVPESKGVFSKFVQVLGKNSLVIYLTHQGLLFPLAYLISLI